MTNTNTNTNNASADFIVHINHLGFSTEEAAHLINMAIDGVIVGDIEAAPKGWLAACLERYLCEKSRGEEISLDFLYVKPVKTAKPESPIKEVKKPMSKTAKVLVGVGAIAAVAAAGLYLFKSNKDVDTLEIFTE